ncbi:hypothetical protein D4R51_02395 [bacterium]|nr:MAG: hypothetical protein D4R51_02395 [bacterium]
MNPIRKIIFTLMLLGVLFFCGSYFASAADIVNVDFPCPTNPSLGACPPTADIPSYLNNLYRFAVGIAGLLALGFIVAGGVYYTISSGSGDKQREARSMITSALLGVALLFGSYLILNTVNPQITKLGELKLRVDSAPSLPSSTAQSVGEGEGGCGGDFKKLNVYTPGSAVSWSPASNCGYRKLFNTAEFKIDGNDAYYYDSSYTVKAGSAVWVYPYFRLDSPGNNACLIYAYREPNPTGRSTSTTFVDLKSTIRLCAPQKQITSAPCTLWRFEALSSISGDENGSWAPVVVDVVVSQAFDHPDQFSPPPTLQIGSSVIPNNKKVCYTDYCKNQNWRCTCTTANCPPSP